MQSQQVTPAIEVSLQYNAKALGVKTVLGEVAVIGLVVNPHGEVAIWINKILKVKVADETGRRIGVVAIAELAVEQQAVVEHASAEQALVFGVVPSLITRRNVGPEIPVVVLGDRVEDGIQLLADGTAENALHSQRCTALLLGCQR